MKKAVHRTVLLGIFLVFGSAGMADESSGPTSNLDVDCSSPSNTIEMQYCSSHSYDEADKEMNDLYQQQMHTLTTEKSKQRLRDSQRAWLVFRDKACLYEVGDESGTIFSQEMNACLEAHTKQRIEDLNPMWLAPTMGALSSGRKVCRRSEARMHEALEL